MPADGPRPEGSGGGDAGVSRRQVLRTVGTTAIASGILAVPAGGAGPRCATCVTLGTVEGQPELGDTYEFSHGDRTVTIDVEEVTRDDGEVVCADFRVEGGSLCRISVTGGSRTRVRRFDTGIGSIYPCAPTHPRPNRRNYPVSTVTFSLCLPQGGERAGAHDEMSDRDDSGQPDHGGTDYPTSPDETGSGSLAHHDRPEHHETEGHRGRRNRPDHARDWPEHETVDTHRRRHDYRSDKRPGHQHGDRNDYGDDDTRDDHDGLGDDYHGDTDATPPSRSLRGGRPCRGSDGEKKR